MVRRRRIRHAGAGSSTDAPRDRWPWLRPAYRERQTIRPFAGRGELLPFPQTLHHPAYRTDPNSTATTDNSRAKKKQNCRTICERSHRSPQPQRPNVVSEWARKRKRTGSHIERVRTDAGCRGEALTQSQSDSDVCTGFPHFASVQSGWEVHHVRSKKPHRCVKTARPINNTHADTGTGA